MNFIRENAFLVALVAVVLVVGTVLIVVNTSVAGDIAKRKTVRENLLKSLKKNSRTVVNDKIITQRENLVQMIQDDYENVVGMNVEWNRRNYKILEYDPVGDGKKVAAFPMPTDRLDDFNTWNLTSAYREQLLGMLARLRPASPPTAAEIERETAAVQKRLNLERWEREEREKKEAATRPGGVEGVPSPVRPTGPIIDPRSPRPGGFPGSRGFPFGSEGPGARSGPGGPGSYPPSRPPSAYPTGPGRVPTGYSPSGTGQDAGPDAKTEATESLMHSHAGAGRIYVGIGNLDEFFPAPANNVPLEELWASQVNLWVTRDILAAIEETNQQALKTVPQEARENPSVLNAAVKRLVQIDITEAYFGLKPGAARSTGGPSVAPGGPGRGRFPGGPMGPGGPGRMGPGMGYPGMGGAAAAGQAGTSQDGAADTLTRRTTEKQYEVVHYNFTVVMPYRFLSDLLKNLARQNLHTPLNIKTADASEDFQMGFYYGAEPVMKVTIHGELLLLTAWARGTYDFTTKTWSKKYPPVLPVEILESLKSTGGDALRTEDELRLGRSSNRFVN